MYIFMLWQVALPNFSRLCGIEQSDSFTLLGVTLQND